jgi:hypothetical protein
MPPQKPVAMGKQSNANRRPREGGPGGLRDSATPGVETTGSTSKIKIRISYSSMRNSSQPRRVECDEHKPGEGQEERQTADHGDVKYLPVADQGPQARRSERVPKKRQDDAFMFGSEMDTEESEKGTEEISSSSRK